MYRYFLTYLFAMLFTSFSLATYALKLDVYNAEEAAMFPVSSVLIMGKSEAILIDAQFGRKQAEELVQKIKLSGKTLSTIYISHGDPVYYFGLDTLKAAFPNVKILASAPTVKHIQNTYQRKLTYWTPILGNDAPQRVIFPEVLVGNNLTIDGEQIEIKGLDGPQPDRSFVWIPSLRAVVGGVLISNNMHVWMADSQSDESKAIWLTSLNNIQALDPKVIVPGHYLPGPVSSLDSIRFTADYINSFKLNSTLTANSEELVKEMKERYPAAGGYSTLEFSAKVAKGEIKW